MIASIFSIALGQSVLITGGKPSYSQYYKPEHCRLHNLPTGKRPYSILTVAPRAFDKGADYVRIVVQHELIHYVLQANGDDPHNDRFDAIAAQLGVPKQYRD